MFTSVIRMYVTVKQKHVIETNRKQAVFIKEHAKGTDDRFASLCTFPTGSCYEGTKVKKPSELDWMLVMKDLSIRYIGYRIRETICIVYMESLTICYFDIYTSSFFATIATLCNNARPQVKI